MEPLVSVVILTWNRRDDLRESLLKLKRQSHKNLEIVVVDNHSEDGTVSMLEKEFKEVKLIKLPKNIGVEGYNIGFKESKGEYVVVLDDDSSPLRDTIKKAIPIFTSNPKLGIIAGNIKNPDGGSETNDWVSVYEKIKGPTHGKAFPWFTFIGCGAVIKKEVFKKAGYYPPEYFLYWNENDFSARVLAAGYEIEYHPEIVFEHRVSKSQRPSGRKAFYATRNMYWFVLKYFPLFLVLDLLPGVALRQLNWVLKEKAPIGAYFKAGFAAFWGISKILRARQLLPSFALKKYEIYLKTTRFSQILKNKTLKFIRCPK